MARRPKGRPIKPCIKCHVPTTNCGFGMCKKCWAHEYGQRPEVKERVRLYNQRPDQKERRRLYGKRRQQLPEVKEYERVRHREQRARKQVIKCPGCARDKKLYQRGLCRQCCDYQRYGGREKYNRKKRLEAKKYRSTPRGKATVKAYNSTSAERKREWRRDARKDPVYARREREEARRWWNSRSEEYKAERRKAFRDWWFFHTGKPVGPFDPNEMRNDTLLRTLRKVREGREEGL